MVAKRCASAVATPIPTATPTPTDEPTHTATPALISTVPPTATPESDAAHASHVSKDGPASNLAGDGEVVADVEQVLGAHKTQVESEQSFLLMISKWMEE